MADKPSSPAPGLPIDCSKCAGKDPMVSFRGYFEEKDLILAVKVVRSDALHQGIMPCLTGGPSALGRWQLQEAAQVPGDGVVFVHVSKEDFPMRFKFVIRRPNSVIWHQGQDIQIQAAPFRRTMDVSFFLGEVTDIEKRPILNGDYSWGPNYDWALRNKDPVHVLIEVSTVKDAMALCRWRYHMLNCLRVPFDRFRAMCLQDGILVPEEGRLLPRTSRLVPVVRNLNAGTAGLDTISEERGRSDSTPGSEAEGEEKSSNPVIRIFAAAAEAVMRPLTPKLEGRSGSRPTTPTASPRAGAQPPPINDLPPLAVSAPDARRQLDFTGTQSERTLSPSGPRAGVASPNSAAKSAFSAHRSSSAQPTLGGSPSSLSSEAPPARPTTPTSFKTSQAARAEKAGGGIFGWVSSLGSGKGSPGSVERMESERKLDPFVLDCDKETAARITELRNKRDPAVVALVHEVEMLKEALLQLRNAESDARERLARRDADVAALEGKLAELGGAPKADWRAAGAPPQAPPKDLAEAERQLREARASASASASAHRATEARLASAGEEMAGLREAALKAAAEVKVKDRHIGVLDALLEERAAELAAAQREVERLKGELAGSDRQTSDRVNAVQEKVKEGEKREKAALERAKKAEKSLEEALSKARRAEEERDYWKADLDRVKTASAHQIENVERVARERERALQAKTAENTELTGQIWSLGDSIGASQACHGRTPRVAACWDSVVGKRSSLPHSSTAPAAAGGGAATASPLAGAKQATPSPSNGKKGFF
eukprot:tig00000498_g1655.t1